MLVNPEIYLEVMNILLQTDVWYDMEDNNPIISSASENIFDKLEKLRGQLSDEVWTSLVMIYSTIFRQAPKQLFCTVSKWLPL